MAAPMSDTNGSSLSAALAHDYVPVSSSGVKNDESIDDVKESALVSEPRAVNSGTPFAEKAENQELRREPDQINFGGGLEPLRVVNRGGSIAEKNVYDIYDGGKMETSYL
eukprot:m.220472 g.220472  ORF g.220472 m.220472 type:complete len:110 (+) comp39942_c1_seq2:2-331(+)